MRKKKNLQKIQKSEKILISFILLCICIVNIFIFGILKINKNIDQKNIVYANVYEEELAPYKFISDSNSKFEVYQNNILINTFNNYEEALVYAKKYANSAIKILGQNSYIWDSQKPFEVYQNSRLINLFSSYEEALAYAKKYANSAIKKSDANRCMWDSKRQFEVYQNDNLINLFASYEEALEYAKKYGNSSIKKSEENSWLWDSNPQFEVYQNYNLINKFSNYKEALEYAKKYSNSYVFYRKSSTFIWDSNTNIKNSYVIQGVPFIGQYPELARGCEVTSLAMLLNYQGTKVSKMELAKNINKEPFSFKLKDDNGVKTYNGNPNIGFVGDIYSIKKSGYGVYNEPICNLLSNYIGTKALNLTGADFNDLYYYINKNRPILAIVNTRFKALPESEFEYLKTTRGNVKITYREHAVLITGYDENYIYFNDPMHPSSIQKKPKNDFIKAWEQMGKQAITYVP